MGETLDKNNEPEKRRPFDDTYNGKTLDDAAAEAGGYVLWEPGKKIEHYHFGEARKYCIEKGIKTSDLTEDDWDMFRIDPSESKL